MIRTEADIERELAALLQLDASLQGVLTEAGTVSLRLTPPGLGGLLSVIMGQQVSRASAMAIFERLAARVDVDDPAALALLTDDDLKLAGLSRAKMRTLRAIAAACLDGRLDLARIAVAEPEAALAELVALHGIGPWTAECHLLFSIGHCDIFPAGDLALQVAVARAFALPARPSQQALSRLAERWRPHRSIAARLFWAYYAAIIRRDTTPGVKSATARGMNE